MNLVTVLQKGKKPPLCCIAETEFLLEALSCGYQHFAVKEDRVSDW